VKWFIASKPKNRDADKHYTPSIQLC